MLKINAEWATTIFKRDKYAKRFKKWFDDVFSIEFPELATNFTWSEDTDDEGLIYAVDNIAVEELAFYGLLCLYKAYGGKKREKIYFNIPNTKDFYSTRVGEVELDPDIAESIKLLNEKGYVTVASCSGHVNPDTTISAGYIWIKDIPKNLPAGFFKHKKLDKDVIRWKANTQKGLEQKWSDLSNWVESLPERNSNA